MYTKIPCKYSKSLIGRNFRLESSQTSFQCRGLATSPVDVDDNLSLTSLVWWFSVFYKKSFNVISSLKKKRNFLSQLRWLRISAWDCFRYWNQWPNVNKNKVITVNFLWLTSEWLIEMLPFKSKYVLSYCCNMP